ncbi:hypothetical protein M9458_014483, partial [Cirrhinus mrigala]
MGASLGPDGSCVLCGSYKQNHHMAKTHNRVGPELRGLQGAMQRFNQRFIYG